MTDAVQTDTATSRDWITEDLIITGCYPGDKPSTTSEPRKEVMESLEKSLVEHADVWAELAAV